MIISLCALPDGIIGKQFSFWSTRQSKITGLRRLDHLLDRGVEIGRVGAADAMRAVGLGELDEVGQRIGVALGIAAAVQELLPLAHHAHVLVVEDEDLDRQAILDRRRHLLHVHQDRGFAGDVDDERLRMRELRADRRRQAVAHRAEAARGHPAVRLLEAEMLRRPHLMLADLGGDVDVAALGQLVEPLDRVLRLDDLVGVAEAEGIARPPAVDRAPPFGERGRIGLMRARAPQPHHVLEHMGAVADDAEVDLDVLVDRGRVDVDVDLLRLRREGVDAAGDAVVEARADADHQIAVVHGVVGLERAVHAEHAEPLLVGGGIGAEAHQRRGDREAGRAHELAQQRRGVRAGIDDAAAGVEDRLLRRRPSSRPRGGPDRDRP